MVKEVYKIMKNDEISRIAKSDPLIVQAGNGGLGVGGVVPSDSEELAALALAVRKTLSLKKRRKKNTRPNADSSSEDEKKHISVKRPCVGKKSWKKAPRTLNENEAKKKKKEHLQPHVIVIVTTR